MGHLDLDDSRLLWKDSLDLCADRMHVAVIDDSNVRQAGPHPEAHVHRRLVHQAREEPALTPVGRPQLVVELDCRRGSRRKISAPCSHSIVTSSL
jgi:hypothetical protein